MRSDDPYPDFIDHKKMFEIPALLQGDRRQAIRQEFRSLIRSGDNRQERHKLDTRDFRKHGRTPHDESRAQFGEDGLHISDELVVDSSHAHGGLFPVE